MIRPLPLVLAAGFLLSSQAAWGKPKVALTPIEGDATGDVHDAVVEALEGNELSLIAGREVTRAIDKLGDLADLTEKDFRKLANELAADAIVLGKLDKVGTARTLKFRLFIHKKMAKGFTVSFKDPKSEKFRAALHDKMVDKLGALVAQDEPEPRPVKKRLAEEEDTRPRASDDDELRPRAPADDEAPRRAKKKVAAADDIENGVTTRVDPSRPANRAAIRVDAGLSVLRRSFEFSSSAFPEAPRNVDLAPVPGIRFETELYPLAFSSPRSAAAGLGLYAEYDRTLSLNLTTQNSTTTFTLPVKQSHYSIGARYRFAFGRTETSPTLTLGVGYGRRLFSPDRSSVTDPALRAATLRDTPQTNYAIIDPGLMFRIPVTRMVALSLGARGLIVTDAGSIQNGDSYGRAKIYGGEGLAALDVVLSRRFALRFSGEFAQIGVAFDGVGTLANSLDGNPMTADVGGLSDRSIGGAATFAVMY
jgi:hypothetical protein